MMNTIFRELLQKGTLVNYMDDFVIPAKSQRELEERTIQFLEVADKHNLFFKRSKCVFDTDEIPILGFVVGNGQVRMEEEKVKAVKEWPVPKTVKDVERFLGFANFYRRFIEGFSTITAPLNELKKKESPWKWETEQQEAFEKLKKTITEEPVLAMPRDEGDLRVEVDASGVGIGGVLSQEQDGHWRPLAFHSRTMTPAERNYQIYDKELLAVREALKTWRHYLLDAKEPFEIWTDHKNLEYFKKPQQLNGRQARWHLDLQAYNFKLKHIPGKTNTKADILSRIMKVDTDNDNMDVTLLPEELFEDEDMEVRGMMEIIGGDLVMEGIRNENRRETQWLMEKSKHPEKAYELDGIPYYADRIYIPPNHQLREEILRQNHDETDVGHPGQHRMIELIKRTYWWPQMRNDIK
jgi:hypothetical protein